MIAKECRDCGQPIGFSEIKGRIMPVDESGKKHTCKPVRKEQAERLDKLDGQMRSLRYELREIKFYLGELVAHLTPLGTNPFTAVDNSEK